MPYPGRRRRSSTLRSYSRSRLLSCHIKYSELRWQCLHPISEPFSRSGKGSPVKVKLKDTFGWSLLAVLLDPGCQPQDKMKVSRLTRARSHPEHASYQDWRNTWCTHFQGSMYLAESIRSCLCPNRPPLCSSSRPRPHMQRI